MNKEKSAAALERKIYRAIEAGEFVPDYGYLSNKAFIIKGGGRVVEVPIGPCGCALAAAATVNGIKPKNGPYASQDELVSFLKEKVKLSKPDALAMEQGYEDAICRAPSSFSANPYFQLGLRLHRFHPVRNGFAE